jgi:hypothetical protein
LEEEDGVVVGRGRVGGAVLNTGVIAESSERVQRHSMSAWSYCMTHSTHTGSPLAYLLRVVFFFQKIYGTNPLKICRRVEQVTTACM